jgi:hypothetical protein
VNDFLWGVLTTLSWVVALFFLKYWRLSRDRFLLLFSLAFWVFGVNWMMAAFVTLEHEAEHYTYVVRLLAFSLIIAAIVQKNREASH